MLKQNMILKRKIIAFIVVVFLILVVSGEIFSLNGQEINIVCKDITVTRITYEVKHRRTNGRTHSYRHYYLLGEDANEKEVRLEGDAPINPKTGKKAVEGDIIEVYQKEGKEDERVWYKTIDQLMSNENSHFFMWGAILIYALMGIVFIIRA